MKYPNRQTGKESSLVAASDPGETGRVERGPQSAQEETPRTQNQGTAPPHTTPTNFPLGNQHECTAAAQLQT